MKYPDPGNKRNGKNYWLFLNPYVYVSVKKDRAILYNTLNHRLLQYERPSPVFKLIKRLDTDSNLYVIKLKSDQIDAGISEFIDQIKNLYFGDLMDTALSKKKPIQLKPILNLQRILGYLTIGDEESRILVNDDIPDYLNIITLYINDDCPQSCPMCPDAYKQFLCCHKRDRHNKQLTLEDTRTLISQIRNSNLHKFNITGGNIFAYPGLEELVTYLNGSRIIKAYCVHYLNIEDRPGFFKLIQDGNNQIIITVHFPA
ncbi:MAG: hypothetical protein GY950_06660, partial [bacterium]|nr:hypothetical protein [bacterium]